MINSNSQNILGLKELPGAILKNVMLPKKTSYTFTMRHDDFLRCKMKSARLWYALARGGIKKADVTYSSAGEFTVKNITWWSCPMYSVKTEDEITAAVQKAKQKNVREFGLLVEKEFFDKCQKNPYPKDVALLKGGLFSFGSAYEHDGSCVYCYQQCQYKSLYIIEGALDPSSAQKVLDAGMNGTETVAFLLNPSSWNLTLRNNEDLSEWSARAGLRGSYIQRTELKAYIFGTEQDAFYPAVRILASVKNGTEDKLLPKYRKTLAVAQKLIENVNGSDLEKYQQIHDILCGKIMYEINPKCEDNGSCVGALLNGKAKCDGYSDAFYLCCGLKKLQVAYQVGKSKVQRKYNEEDNHIWNLIFLDGIWRGVDVTWDGGGNDTSHDFFNIGLDRMKPVYSFSNFMLPENMTARTNQFERAEQEYQVSSENDMTDALNRMATLNKDKITLRCSETFYNKFLRDDGLLWRLLARAGGQECDCRHRAGIITLSNLVKFSHWKYCDTKEAISKAAENIIKDKLPEFTFVFEPKLFKQFFDGKNKLTELRYLLAVSGLDSEACQYNEKTCTIILQKIKPYNAFTAKVSTSSEMKEKVKIGCRSGKAVLDLWFSSVLFQKVIKEPQLLFSTIQDMGINGRISWSYNQNDARIQVQMN